MLLFELKNTFAKETLTRRKWHKSSVSDADWNSYIFLLEKKPECINTKVFCDENAEINVKFTAVKNNYNYKNNIFAPYLFFIKVLLLYS